MSDAVDGWWRSSLCPWDLEQCGDEPLGKHGDESLGAPLERLERRHREKQDKRYAGEIGRRSMSCGLCGWLLRTLGPPPFMLPIPHDVGDVYLQDGMEAAAGRWDLIPFGVFLANQQHKEGARHRWETKVVVDQIYRNRASTGQAGHHTVLVWCILSVCTAPGKYIVTRPT